MSRIFSFIRAIKRKFLEPKKGESYVGDTFDFLVGKSMEQILHGLRNRSGQLEFIYWEGTENYRLTIESVQPTYYVCKAEVLVKDMSGGKFYWKQRSQPRRILMNDLKDMILDKRIKKYD